MVSIRGDSGTTVVSDRFIHHIYIQSDLRLFLDRLRAIYCELCMFGCMYVACRVNRGLVLMLDGLRVLMRPYSEAHAWCACSCVHI